MTPSAEPASTRAEVAGYLVPANLLSDGEIVILAIKPSGWFVLLSSLPVVLAAVIVAGAIALGSGYRNWLPTGATVSFCVALVLGRMIVACWQWMGRTYVLTNRRIVAVRGLVTGTWTAMLLAEVCRAELAASSYDRLLGTGSIHCLSDPDARPVVSWVTISRPAEVNQIVQEAVRRARMGKSKPTGPDAPSVNP